MSLRAARSTAALTRVGPQCRRAVCTTASIRHDAYCVLPQLEHVKRKRLRVKMSVEAALGATHKAPHRASHLASPRVLLQMDHLQEQGVEPDGAACHPEGLTEDGSGCG
jgi:hypothetical protein